MEDRYPYIRFVIDAAQPIAGAVALIVLLAGGVNSCHHGGFFGGLVSFLITVAFAAVAYVVVMVKIEVLRVLLDLEQTTRQSRSSPQPPGASSAGTVS